ncbi:MAG: heavy metal-associated domain-containing protein [Candidatus Micrarchaeota archaeon]
MDKIIKVKGMHCKSCAAVLTGSISEIPGVTNVKVDYKEGKVTVSIASEAITQKIIEIIKNEGYAPEG